MFACLRHKNKLFWHVKATEGESGVICTREQNKTKKKTKNKKKKKNKRKEYTGVQIVHFYRLLQVDVISKRENSLGYTGRQVNSLTGLSSLISFRLIQGKSIVEDEKPLGQSVKFHMELLWDRGMKVCSNGPGHMTKMAAMPVYGENLKKSSSLEPKG